MVESTGNRSSRAISTTSASPSVVTIAACAFTDSKAGDNAWMVSRCNIRLSKVMIMDGCSEVKVMGGVISQHYQ